ncbi:hypothetical protein VIBNIAM115_1380002 [Vibrio nigripulchritudo AM115]|nr:hypothetical protein VIBNIAM115_1380002 [Vibrio nigripulchritudo AM115]
MRSYPEKRVHPLLKVINKSWMIFDDFCHTNIFIDKRKKGA